VMRNARRHFYHHRRFLRILARCLQVMLGELQRCQGLVPEVPEEVSIRQHTSAYVSIRQHTSAYVSLSAGRWRRKRACQYEAAISPLLRRY
jgi:hypothetical protein